MDRLVQNYFYRNIHFTLFQELYASQYHWTGNITILKCTCNKPMKSMSYFIFVPLNTFNQNVHVHYYKKHKRGQHRWMIAAPDIAAAYQKHYFIQ